MKTRVFEKESTIPAPAREVFDWHKRDGALEDLTPPGDPVSLVDSDGSIEDGATATLKLGYGPLSVHWLARHRNYEEGRRFEDVQERGPFAHWVHTHEVVPIDDASCTLRDHVEYALPGGRLGDVMAGWFVRRKLERMFEHRHRVTRAAFESTG